MQGDTDSDGAKPRIGLTMGDVNGVGPEVVMGAILDSRVRAVCRPVVVGSTEVLEHAFRLFGAGENVRVLDSPSATALSGIDCWQPTAVPSHTPSMVSAEAGQFAADCLRAATRAAQENVFDAICTAPLNKAALAAAGIGFPGHTEMLADACNVDDFAMMLHVSAEALGGLRNLIGTPPHSPHGLAIAHVTLHQSVRSAVDVLTTEAIAQKIRLIHDFLCRLNIDRPAVAVAALNPHAGEDGLFGDEEARLIAPAVRAAQNDGLAVTGPLPADTLIRRAMLGEFHGVVAMYHDQGHIPVKLVAFDRATNVTLGIPVLRTSPTHGTAFDIAWQGQADPSGMIEAVLLAAQLARHRAGSKA